MQNFSKTPPASPYSLMPHPQRHAQLHRHRLTAAILIALIVMATAIAIGLAVAIYSDFFTLGFIPLIIAWLGLYRLFERLAQ